MSKFHHQSPYYAAAFSLVEIAISLAVVSFCLVALMALLPVGLSSDNDTKQMTFASSLAAEVAADLRTTPTVSQNQAQGGSGSSVSSPLFGFSISGPGGAVSTNPQTLFFGGDGSFSSSAESASLYRVSLVCTPPSTGERGVTSVRIVITWPALADPTRSTWPAHAMGSFEALIALNRN